MSQKILVVEDELFMLRLIQHTLSKAGYELIEARTSEEARAAIEHQKPSIVVRDSKFRESTLHPVLDGLQNHGKAPPIPMICMSNEPPTGDQNDGEVTFTKPFSPMKLIAEVRRLSANATTPAGGNL
ncbi:MAG: response regulator [Verrucomicrobia bacterium]|nr:response regulator [Verrucomicrobiota bacterium]